MFKNLALAVMAVMAVSVISEPASAQRDDRREDRQERREDRQERREDRREDREDRREDRIEDRNQVYGRALCTTTSRGYTFRAEGRNQQEASFNVQNLCLNHPYASQECRYAVRCQQIGGGGYPYPQPAPRVYTCQTFARGQWYRAQAPRLQGAQRKVLNQCYSYSGKPRQCDRNLQCGY